MDDQLERSRLSRTSLLALAILLLANILVIGYFLTDPAEDSEPAVRPQPAAPGIRLLTELTEDELSDLSRDTQQTAPDAAMNWEGETAPVEADGQPIIAEDEIQAIAGENKQIACRVWGPITSTQELTLLRADIDLVGEVIEVRVQELATAPDYLVYLQTDNNLDNARRIKQELDSQSIDAYVMAGGEYVNSVSAGVFSSQERARRQAQRLADLGYSPRTAALARRQAVYHIIARVPEVFELEDRESVECSEIASAR